MAVHPRVISSHFCLLLPPILQEEEEEAIRLASMTPEQRLQARVKELEARVLELEEENAELRAASPVGKGSAAAKARLSPK